MNILLAGVGGQGIILASNILSEVAMNMGYDVKKSEVHGMSQRGGSVSSHVRFGEKIHSPLVEVGTADFLLAFEKLEALRQISYLEKDGRIVVNNQQIEPMPVSAGLDEYPGNVIEMLKSHTDKIDLVNALDIARNLKNIRVVNVVMLGALSRYIDIDESVWEKMIKQHVPEGTEEVNLEAFSLGRSGKEAGEQVSFFKEACLPQAGASR